MHISTFATGICSLHLAQTRNQKGSSYRCPTQKRQSEITTTTTTGDRTLRGSNRIFLLRAQTDATHTLNTQMCLLAARQARCNIADDEYNIADDEYSIADDEHSNAL